MSAESNINLVTNNNDVVQILKPKLILLREVDNISMTKYSNAFENIKQELPDAILIHCKEE